MNIYDASSLAVSSTMRVEFPLNHTVPSGAVTLWLDAVNGLRSEEFSTTSTVLQTGALTRLLGAAYAAYPFTREER
jgi:hypothetical protein